MSESVSETKNNSKTLGLLILTAVGMLGLGFASKPLYDTFCKITGYGGTTRQAEVNNSPVIDRDMRVSFDSNVSRELPWSFKPDVPFVDVKVGQSTLAYYKVTKTLQPGETVDFPVIFFVDSLIDEETRNDDVKNITLSYTFFETEQTDLAGTTSSNKSIGALN